MSLRSGRRGRTASRRPGAERGLGLTEVIVATLVATVAVLGLAYTIGTGRALVNRYAFARSGLAEAQRVLESLSVLPVTAPELAIPPGQTSASHAVPFVYRGGQVGWSVWTVSWRHDPADPDPGGQSLRQVVVRVSWLAGADSDAVSLSRYVAAR